MNSSSKRFYSDKRFAFIDSMSSVIGLSIGSIELAAIASASNLGSNGLEFFVGISAASAILFEGVGASLTQRFGCSRVLLFSVVMKAWAHATLLAAIVFSINGENSISWVLLMTEASINSTATGGIIASYRPSYGLWYKENTGVSIDLMQNIAFHKLFRAIGPVIIWLLIFGFIIVFKNHTNELALPIILLLSAIGLRIAQYILYRRDLYSIFEIDRDKFASRSMNSGFIRNLLNTIGIASSRLNFVIRNYTLYLLYYVYGNLVFLIVVSYLLGDVARTLVHQSLNPSIMTMYGILAGLIVHLLSSLIGARYYPKVSSGKRLKLVGATATILAILCVIIIVSGDKISSVFALITISFLFHLFGVGIVRSVSTSFMRVSQEDVQSIFFSLSEILSSSALLLLMLMLTVFDDRAVGISIMSMLIIVFGLSCFLLTLRRKQNLTAPDN